MAKKFIILNGEASNVLKDIPDETFHSIVTSPPYWSMRDYSADDQLGVEETPEEYVEKLVAILREARRTLRNDGTLWLNIGDTYNNTAGFIRNTKPEWQRDGRTGGTADKKFIKHSTVKKKDLFGLPWKVAFALQEDGWYLRCDICWSKANCFPDGAKDRPTRSHEYIFLLSKSEKYFYDYYGALEDTSRYRSTRSFGARNPEGTGRQDGNRVFEDYGKRNRRSVWETSVSNYKGKHYATYPPELIEPCILASVSPEGCCAKCGKPIERITEKEKVPAMNNKGYELKLLSKGWQKTCDCDTNEKRPCLVLDPFSGMATTGLVAMQYKAYYVGIEINEEYLRASKDRLYDADFYDTEEVDNINELINEG